MSISAFLSTEDEDVSFGVKAATSINIDNSISAGTPLSRVWRLEFFKATEGFLADTKPVEAGCLMVTFAMLVNAFEGFDTVLRTDHFLSFHKDSRAEELATVRYPLITGERYRLAG